MAASEAERRPQLSFRPGLMPALYGDTASALIVDDDEQIGRVLERVLHRGGYHCETSLTASDARNRLAEGEFAVALIDVLMPDESGLELVADLLGKYRDLAVVMVSGVDDPSIAELALESGAYGYVVKPFQPNQVLITVANAGRRRCLEIERRLQHEGLERLLADRTAELGDVRELVDDRLDADVSLSALEAEEGQGRASAAGEVSRRRQGNVASAALDAHAERARFEHLGQLAGSVAHDFNNLLAVILNYTDFIGEQVADASLAEGDKWDRVGRDLAEVKLAAQRAVELTHQLLSFERGEVVQPR